MITHTKNLSRDWSLHNETLDRVRKEDNARWSQREEVQELPKYEKVVKRRYKLGEVWGFISSFMSI